MQHPASRRGVVLLFVAFKDQFAFPRRVFVKEIAFAVKTGQLLRLGQAVLNDIAAHEAPRLFGIEADDLELAVFLIQEDRLDDLRIQLFRFHRLVVFIGCQVNHHVIALSA